MSWTDAEREAMAYANTSTMHLWALELRHSVFPSPVRLIQNDIDVDVTLEAAAPVNAGATVTFVATAFRFREPDNSNQPDPTVQIDIDGVSGSLQPFLQAAVLSGEPIECTLRAILYDTKAQATVALLRALHLQMRREKTTMTTIAATFGYTNPANQPFPSQAYSAETNPGLVS